MKDYSMNLDDRKDFVLGYDITSDGMIKIKFAKGKPWFVPYNAENEQILLAKMEKQLEKNDDIESKLEKKVTNCFVCFLGFVGAGLLVGTFAFNSDFVREIIITSSVACGFGIIPGILALKANSKLSDLRKNVRFLEMKEKLNKVVRSEQNTLVNVSSKTKNAIKDFPEDKPIFNINSFNYVPFSDLEQIIENVDRNDRFGFNYTQQEEPVIGVTRKRTR